jgi:phosphatidylglycerol:prolipoprotein diacylglycerol transferase
MIDSHFHPENWGIKPVLFEIGNFHVSSYSFFIMLALVVGIIVYYFEAKKKNSLNEKNFYIFIAAIAGGIIGAKIFHILEHFTKAF